MKDNKGISLTVLAITVVVLLILASIGVFTGVSAIEDSREQKQIAELNMIQHAVIENYTKYQQLKDLPNSNVEGLIKIDNNTVEESKVQDIINEINGKVENQINITNKADFYELNLENCEKLGLQKIEDKYFVKFATGEVINSTVKVTKSGVPLYVKATN